MKIDKYINKYIDYMKYERGFAENTIIGRKKLF